MPPACHPEEALPTKDPDGARWDVLPYTDKPALRRGRDPSLREAMTGGRADRSVDRSLRGERRRTSSAPVCALGHLPPEGGRLGRAHRDAPLRQRREIDSLRHGEPLPSAPLTAPPEGEPRGAGTSSGASRHLPRARGRLEGGQAHGCPSGGDGFCCPQGRGFFSKRMSSSSKPLSRKGPVAPAASV